LVYFWLSCAVDAELSFEFATAGLTAIPSALTPVLTPSFPQGLKLTLIARLSLTGSSGAMRTLARLLSDTVRGSLIDLVLDDT
jgi:branched-subunit amino acid permease